MAKVAIKNYMRKTDYFGGILRDERDFIPGNTYIAHFFMQRDSPHRGLIGRSPAVAVSIPPKCQGVKNY